MKRFALIAVPFWLAGPLAAHPHIFVDTGLEMQFDERGLLSSVRVTWTYDEFYSLLITEDRGLDPDFDGVLTPEETASLRGFDMQWVEGFNGDLVVTQAGRKLTLSGPQDATASYEDGRITTTHVRRVNPAELTDAWITVKPYDPTYYTAYDVTLPVLVDGPEGCGHSIEMPDIDARLRELRDILMTLDTDTTPEEAGLPDLGGLLATTVTVSCDMS